MGESSDWFSQKFQLSICGKRMGAKGAQKLVFALVATLVLVVVAWVATASSPGTTTVAGDDDAYHRGPTHAANVRRKAECPDGFEHQHDDGSWMCGKQHHNEHENHNRSPASGAKCHKPQLPLVPFFSVIADADAGKATCAGDAGASCVTQGTIKIVDGPCDGVKGMLFDSDDSMVLVSKGGRKGLEISSR